MTAEEVVAQARGLVNEWRRISDEAALIYNTAAYGRCADDLAAVLGEGPADSAVFRLREAALLIAGDCSDPNYGRTCTEDASSPRDEWCPQCIARDALAAEVNQ